FVFMAPILRSVRIRASLRGVSIRVSIFLATVRSASCARMIRPSRPTKARRNQKAVVVQRFTRERIVQAVRVILIATLLGAGVGTISSAIIGVGVQYLGPLEGYRLGALVGSLIGGVYGGTSGLGIRGL